MELIPMNATERMYTAVAGGVPDRVPVYPKMWLDVAGVITDTDFCEMIRNPILILSTMMEAGLIVGADAVRQFHHRPRDLAVEDDKVYEIDKSGKKIGKVDMDGGWATHLNDPKTFTFEDDYTMAFFRDWCCFDEPVIRSVDEARRIAVPDKSIYEQIGCGDLQRKVTEMADGRIELIGDLKTATMSFMTIMRGLETSMLDVLDNPQLAHAIMEKGAAIAIERGKWCCDLGHRVLRLNDSAGTNSLISPKTWRQFILPHMRTVCQAMHAYEPECRIYVHICGDIKAMIEDLIELGMDCIGPLDPLGKMEPAQIREQVADRASLMGGVDTLSFLNHTPEQVEQEAADCIRGAGMNGGYVLSSGCAIPRASNKENLIALRTAADKYGIYENGRLKAS